MLLPSMSVEGAVFLVYYSLLSTLYPTYVLPHSNRY